MKRIFLTLALSLLALPALALDLHAARSANMVGEKQDGYVAALKPTPDVATLVSEVNGKRKDEYTRISQQNGQSVAVVAKLAAAQIIQGLEPGNSYQADDGSWKNR